MAVDKSIQGKRNRNRTLLFYRSSALPPASEGTSAPLKRTLPKKRASAAKKPKGASVASKADMVVLGNAGDDMPIVRSRRTRTSRVGSPAQVAVEGLARFVFDGDMDSATRFMHSPNDLLEGVSPWTVVDQPGGRERVEAILWGIEYSLPV